MQTKIRRWRFRVVLKDWARSLRALDSEEEPKRYIPKILDVLLMEVRGVLRPKPKLHLGGRN